MRLRAGAVAVMMVVSAGAAWAEPFDASDWNRKIEALVQSLIGGPPVDHDVILPPGNTDPQMALAPPQSDDTMPMIAPPGKLRQR